MIAEVDKQHRFFNDTDVVNGVNYTYYVVAYNFEGDGKRSPYVQVTPEGRSLPPSDIKVIPGSNFILIDWDPPIDSGGYPVVNYNVYKRNIDHYELVTNTTDTFYNDTGLIAPGERGYRISAVTSFGEGRLSDVIIGRLMSPPSVPINFDAEGHDGSVFLSWDPPDFNGGLDLINYTIYRNGSIYVRLDADENNFTDMDVVNGVEYIYRISVSNERGESKKSANVSVIPSGLPDPPSGVLASLGQEYVEITWSPPIDDGGLGIQEYRLYKMIDSEWTQITSTPQLRYSDDEIENGETYSYRMTSVNSRGEGPPGKTVEIEIPEGRIPSAPQGLSITLEKSGVVLTWSEPMDPGDSGVTGYNVYRRSGGQADWNPLDNTEGTNYTDGDVEGNVTYFYVVSASNEYGEGEKSDHTSIVIPANFDPSGDDHQPVEDDDEPSDGNTLLIIIAVAAAILFVILVAGIILFLIVKNNKNGSEALPSDDPGAGILEEIGNTNVTDHNENLNSE